MRNLRMWIVLTFSLSCFSLLAEEPALDKKEAEKKTAEKKVADKKGADAKTTAAKSTTPGVEDMLAGLPTAVSLPPIDDKFKPVSLGKITVPANALLAVALIGGDFGTKAKPRSFVLSPKGEEFVARAWDIQLVSRRTSEDRLIVAHLEIENQQLLFNWTPDAAKDPQAAQFANCAFSLSAGRSQKKITFRKAVKGAPLPLSLTEESEVKWDIPAAPDASRVRVEFRMAGKLPRHRFLGSAILKADGEETWMEVIEKEVAGVLQVKIECKMKSQLELKTTPYLVILEKKMELTTANLKRSDMQLQQTSKNLEQQLSLATDLAKSQPKNTNIANGKAQLDKQLKLVNSARDKLANVRTFVENTPSIAPLQVRAFLEAEDTIVDLMSSSAK